MSSVDSIIEAIQKDLQTHDITGIVLKTGTYIQIQHDHLNIYTDGMSARLYCSKPAVSMKTDIWGAQYLSIGYDVVRIQPADIRQWDVEDKDPEEPEN